MSATPRARGERREENDALFGIALFALALAPRLYVALAWSGEPVWDGHYYDFGARRIASGFGYSDDLTIAGQPTWHPWCHYPVGYSAFLGAAYRMFGASHATAAVANAASGAALAVVTWLLAREALSRPRARGSSLPRPSTAGGSTAARAPAPAHRGAPAVSRARRLPARAPPERCRRSGSKREPRSRTRAM